MHTPGLPAQGPRLLGCTQQQGWARKQKPEVEIRQQQLQGPGELWGWAGRTGRPEMGRLWVGRKVVELRPTPKTLGFATPDPVWDRKPTGSLKESFTHLQAAVESCSLNNWKSCLHLSTPAFLLLNIMFNESCNNLFFYLPKKHMGGRGGN